MFPHILPDHIDLLAGGIAETAMPGNSFQLSNCSSLSLLHEDFLHKFMMFVD